MVVQVSNKYERKRYVFSERKTLPIVSENAAGFTKITRFTALLGLAETQTRRCKTQKGS